MTSVITPQNKANADSCPTQERSECLQQYLGKCFPQKGLALALVAHVLGAEKKEATSIQDTHISAIDLTTPMFCECPGRGILLHLTIHTKTTLTMDLIQKENQLGNS